MKKFRLLIVFVLTILCLLALSACDNVPALQAPTELAVDQATLTLTWKGVEGARLYTIVIEGEGGEAREYMASKNSYALSSLDEGNYTIKIKANGKEDVNRDSDWSQSLPFTREHEPGFVFTLIEDGTAYEVTDKGNAAGHVVIPETYRGKPVKAIGRKAFFNASKITGVTFVGSNLKTIGDFAFANCSYLETMTLPAGLTSLGESAFASCRLLGGELVIPEGITSIPASAFAYCGELTSVKMGTQVTAIGKDAFTDCKKLASVQLPESLVLIDEYAFSACESLTSVSLGNKLETIGAYAFSALEKLESIRIPDSVKNIGEGAFVNCFALHDVTLGTGIEMIDLGAFASTALWENATQNEVYVGKWFLGCKDTTADTLTLRDDTIGIANYALYGNQTLTNVILPDSLRIIGDCAFVGAKVSNVVLGSGVEYIGEQAFAVCKSLITVILGSFDFEQGVLKDSSLKTIGSYAFQGCSALESIEIPATVKVIGSYAFRESGLSAAAEGGLVYAGNWLVDYTEEATGNVTLRENTVGVANYAFYRCEAITGVVVPSSVKYVGRGAFYDCGELLTVTLPNTLEVIEDYTFYHCDKLRLQALKLPPMLKSIGRSAFYKCGSIYVSDGTMDDTDTDTLELPIGVEYIGPYAFYCCGEESLDDALEPVTYGIDILVIGNGVKQIDENAFYGFVSLKKLVIGNSVEQIGAKAFYKCTSLEEIVFGTGLKAIGSKAFYKCTALKALSLSDSVTDVGDYAFYRCEGLEAVALGRGVSRVGSFAFYGCYNLKELQLSTALTQIGRQAFRGCSILQSAVLPAGITQIDAHAFYGCPELTLYAESTAAGAEWHKNWNSSYRPVLWGCVLSEAKDYVISFEKSAVSLTNKNASNTISAPARKGYTFVGWNTSSSATEAAYTSENFMDVADGRRLYAIWAES